MIDLLNEFLAQLFNSQVALLKPAPGEPAGAQHVGFTPPDVEWRHVVKNIGAGRALNVYLVDLREHRKLRSIERARTQVGDALIDLPAPMYMDCHYLISAWSTNSTPADKTSEELAVLYQASAVLANNPVIDPHQVFGAMVPEWFPPEQLDVDWPITLLPPDGFPKMAEFWGTMGADFRWKPVVYMIVTIPVELITVVSGPMVTTLITDYRQTDSPESKEILFQIGGTVWDLDQNPIPNAWVNLEIGGNIAFQRFTTGTDGRFTFSRLSPGSYTLHVQAPGYLEFPQPCDPQQINVPSPDGNYDVILSKTGGSTNGNL